MKQVPKNINGFTLYNKKPNTLDKGYYYQKELFFDIDNDYKNRMIRVYLPSDYDFNNPNKKYPVIYMTDGQNLCDHYLSGYGEWCVDETIEDRLNHHKRGFIAVGIDCPRDEDQRVIEMTISCPSKYAVEEMGVDYVKKLHKGQGFADKLAKFILKTVKPLVDETFFTLKNKKNTAVGGSSMGGLMAFYMGMKYKNIVGYSLCFSPGFLIYKSDYFKRQLTNANLDVSKFGKFFLYVGGVGFEKTFVELTFACYDILTNKGFTCDKLRLVYDTNNIHHEKPWSVYFPIGISFWLDK